VRIALLGLGRMGRFHLRALADSPTVSIVAVADPQPDALAAAAGSLSHAAVHTDPAAALAHPGVEGCIVASPTPSHPEMVRTALAAGLHVLCEKPLALDPAEARALGTEAAAAGLVLQVGFWRRFSPPWFEVNRLLGAGAIGDVVLVRLSQWDAHPPPPEFCDPVVSGGLAVDCGVHEFDLLEWLTAAEASARATEIALAVQESVIRGAPVELG
jgi:myo-inositol 2-dehydrogenase / D-chiro-inositol 1-dehydrogenase